MKQRRCSIYPLELQEKLCEKGIDIEQKGSDSLIFGKNEREKKRITGVMCADRNCEGPRCFFYLKLNDFMCSDSSKMVKGVLKLGSLSNSRCPFFKIHLFAYFSSVAVLTGDIFQICRDAF